MDLAEEGEDPLVDAMSVPSGPTFAQVNLLVSEVTVCAGEKLAACEGNGVRMTQSLHRRMCSTCMHSCVHVQALAQM